jgi:hypothetical protein
MTDFDKGSFTLPANSTSVTVMHNLGKDPMSIVISPTSDTGGKRWQITSHSSIQFVVAVDSAYASAIGFNYICV